MHVGFTGTRNGMTAEQKVGFSRLLTHLQPTHLHHGDCVGADDEAANIAADLGIELICHPPIDETLRAFNARHKEARPAKTHFARNRDIVNESEALIVCPLDMTHQSRGGTWYTYDFAVKRHKPTYVIWPDGTWSHSPNQELS